jgi:hypothetical protein
MIRLGVIWLMFVVFHPVHVSLASLDYDKTGGKFSLFIKVYTDDLENDCRLMTEDPELLLYHNGFTPDADILKRYFDEKIIIEVDGDLLRGIIGEVSSDAEEVRVAIEYDYSGEAKSISVENRIMTDLFPDQANLLIIRIGDLEEGIKFTPEYTKYIINR